MKFDKHDIKVILFHVVVAALQAGLAQLKLENFGANQVFVVLFVQVLSEAVRRFVV